MNDYDREFLKVGAYCFVIVAIGCALIFYGVRAECANRWKDSGMQSRYVQNGGCLVRVGDVWVPELAVKVVP